jgi:hypothetical protein
MLEWVDDALLCHGHPWASIRVNPNNPHEDVPLLYRDFQYRE